MPPNNAGLPLLPLLFAPILLLNTAPAATSDIELSWRVVPPTAKVTLNATVETPVLGSSQYLDVALMGGECEHRQLLLHTAPGQTLYNVTVASSGASGAALAWRFWQVGFVYCESCNNYQNSGGGWKPDVLLDPPFPGIIAPLVPPNTTQPLWIEVCSPRNASGGNVSGALTVSGSLGTVAPEQSATAVTQFSFTVGANVEVWDITMPVMGVTGSMQTSFCFWGDAHDGSGGLANYYPQKHYRSGSAIQQIFYDFLADHGVPADEVYTGTPRPESEMVALAREGVRAITLLDASCACTQGTHSCDCQRNETLSDTYITVVLNILADAIAQLNHTNNGSSQGAQQLLQRLRVYGFDEAAPNQAHAMGQLFGAIHQRWPWLRTMATVGWSPNPSLPLDTWVVAYSKYLHPGTLAAKQADRRAFEGGRPGRETWWYFCNGQGCPQAVNPECNVSTVV